MSRKVFPFPRKHHARKRLDFRNRVLRCEVSPRWIQFPESSALCSDKDFLVLDIMTTGADEKDKKLCEMIIDRKELEEMLEAIPSRDNSET